MIWVLIPHPWLKQSAKDGTNNRHIDDNQHISRVIKVWSCTYLIIFLMIVEVLIVYLIFLWWSKFNHIHFLFWQSSKCNHVFYISTIIEVWSCILYFDSCWSLIILSYIFDGCWGFDHVFYILMVVEVWSCILIFRHNCWSLDNLIISCVFCTHLSNKTCVFFFSPYKP